MAGFLKGDAKQIMNNTSRKRININGAYNPRKADMIFGKEETIDANLLLSIPRGISVSRVLQYIKGKSNRKLLQAFELLRKVLGSASLG